jgi:hypothetical protein
VRDVLGHMSVGHTTPFPAMVVRVARRGFNVTKASYEESQTFVDGRNPKKTVAGLQLTARGELDRRDHARRLHDHSRRRPGDGLLRGRSQRPPGGARRRRRSELNDLGARATS